MALTPNAKAVLEARYLRKDKKGRKETFESMLRRVADNVALADLKYSKPDLVKRLSRRQGDRFFMLADRPEFRRIAAKDKERKATASRFYKMMSSLDFLPNSPTLFNAGRELQQLAGCFVLPVQDSIDAIFEAIHDTALIHQSGGGTGFSFSRLRPAGDSVRSTQGIASGPVSFMRIFDAATEEIKQGGKRRGANMGILRVDHPDIAEFITVKEDESLLRNFNISVAATDAFMQAVKRGKSYALVNPRTGKVWAMRKARDIFHLMCKTAWKTADPGIIFIDTINRHNPTPKLGMMESMNPCGEVPLLPYEACNLGSVNLSRFVKHGVIDYGRLGSVIGDAVHFLDNVIDMSNYPLPEIDAMVKGNRKIGLGVMGFADMLVQLGVSYSSDEALVIAESLMGFINDQAKKASAMLALERGVYPNFKGSVHDTGRKDDRVRNATRTALAPTGTLSLIAGCSSGIEPLFGLAFTHTILDRKGEVEVNKHLLDAARKRGFLSEKFKRQLVESGSLAGVKGVPQDVRRLFVTSHEIPAEQHVRIQAAFQNHTDNAVSKTVNMPNDATVKDVERVYMLAYDLGCKGISVYRYGSKKGQVLNIGKAKERCPVC